MKNFEEDLKIQKEFFYEGNTLDYNFRKNSLINLRNAIKKYEKEIINALKKDLGKSEFEAYTNEIGILYAEINHTLKHLKKWMKKKKVRMELYLQPSKGEIHVEPYGNTLIISPWNYPFQLLIAPLIASISAGNTAILKPSEISTHTENILEKLIKETFDEKYVKLIKGGIEETTALLKLPFDKIFFTGSVSVGKIVMEAASKNLTPVTLELGGKSPAIVLEDANIELAVNKIIWGKFNNAGQTCVAPDYVLIHKSKEKEFLNLSKNKIIEFYGKVPKKNENYGRIINEKNTKRLYNLIDYEKVFTGGEVDFEEKYIEPTIMSNVNLKDKIMEEEIFGPILPVISFEDMNEVYEIIRKFSKPLALYLFTKDTLKEKEIMKKISFGGGGVNTTILHVASSNLPFGGVGTSGIGSYHGESGFLDFSHKKSILRQSSFFDLGLTYPNKKISVELIKKFMK